MKAAPQGAQYSPTAIRLLLLRNGWSPVPVAGKRPTPEAWQKLGLDPPTELEVRRWALTHGAALSTGIVLGRQVAIDLDIIVHTDLAPDIRFMAIEVFGETPFERVGRAPKVALVYRAAPDVVGVKLKAEDGSGDGIDILAGGTQMVAFGVHPDTKQTYKWVGDASPAVCKPTLAPIITQAQIEDFLERVQEIMPLGTGSGVGGGAGGGGFTGIVRNDAGLVCDGRETFLAQCVWKAANELGKDGAELNATAVAETAWAMFSDPATGAVLDGKWKKSDALTKARGTVRRIKDGKAKLRPELPKLEPTYPDRSVPVHEARLAVRKAITEHLAAGPGCRAIRVSTGLGKTTVAAVLIAQDIKRRRATGDYKPFIYAVPTHRLGDEVEALFAAEGVTARVFRGRNAEDPELRGTGTKMCLDMPAVEMALAIGASVSESCCRGKNPETDQISICPLFDRCGYQRQLSAAPNVWIMAHQLLFHSQAALGDPSGVIVDESFWGAGERKASKGLTLDEVGTAPASDNGHPSARIDVAFFRAILVQALRRHEGLGGIERRHLVAEGITAETCTRALAAEWRLKGRPVIWPGMGDLARRTAARSAEGVKRVKPFAAMWHAARELLNETDVDAASGRLYLAERPTDEGKVRVVRTRGIHAIAQQWAEAPTLLMDATMPGLPILRRFYPEVELVADIEAKTPHAWVRQVLEAPTSTNKLDAELNLKAVRRGILKRFMELGRKPTLVIAQLKVAEWLKASGLPDNLSVEHYNATAGLDGYKSVRLIIAVGRTLPTPAEIEATASALTGLQAQKTAGRPEGAWWFEKGFSALRMADGSAVTVEAVKHSDETAEAVRWQACEGELMQALGRARAVNRAASDPVAMEIWSDVVLPITVNETVKWDAREFDEEVEMAISGFVLESPKDMSVVWPQIWKTTKSAEKWRENRTRPQNPINSYTNRVLGACEFRYQHFGERQKWRAGFYDPAVINNPRRWLENRLGRLAKFEIDGISETATAERRRAAEYEKYGDLFD